MIGYRVVQLGMILFFSLHTVYVHAEATSTNTAQYLKSGWILVVGMAMQMVASYMSVSVQVMALP